MVKVLPADTTFIEDCKDSSFVNVPIDKANNNAVSTVEFLNASASLAGLFDVLNSTALTPVKSDIEGNITKVRARYAAAPTESATIQDLVINELKATPKTHVATEGLVWLVRGLDFTCIALTQNLTTPTDEPSTSFKAAYTDTLKPHHGWLVTKVFSAAMSAVPARKTLYDALDNGTGRVEPQLKEWLASLQSILDILKPFMESPAAKW